MKNWKGKLIFFALFLVPIIFYVLWKNAEERYHPLEIFGETEMDGTKTPWTLRDFSLIDQNGDTVGLDDFKDKIIVANFFYATCPSICPRMNNNLRLAVDKFQNTEDVVFISHTVNPAQDTVEALRAYSQRYGYSSDKWKFLTGPKSEIYDLAQNHYHVVAPRPDGEYDFIHSTTIVLIDKEHRVRGYFESNENPSFYKELRDGIHVLLVEYHHKK